MRVLNAIKVTVTEPFSGGKLTLKVNNVQIAPVLYLRAIQKADYEGVSPELAAWHRSHRIPDSYVELFEHLYVHCDGELYWEIEGYPKENVIIQPYFAL